MIKRRAPGKEPFYIASLFGCDQFERLVGNYLIKNAACPLHYFDTIHLIFLPPLGKATFLSYLYSHNKYTMFTAFQLRQSWKWTLLWVLIAACEQGDKNTKTDTPVRTVPTPGFDVVATFPHDTGSYTQGLIIYKGQLYEGTGQYGASALLKTELSTGRSLQRAGLDKMYFGEGITILNDTLYQLTWKEKKIFVYDLNFKKIRSFEIDKEGWGLTNNGTDLILTNGSGDLFFYDPRTMTLRKVQTVTENGSPSYNLNELEYVDGYVYANQYTYPYVLKIDATTGVIVAKYDLSPLWERCKQQYPNSEVPNGIAYDSEQKKWYVTGKYWPLLFQIQLGH